MGCKGSRVRIPPRRPKRKAPDGNVRSFLLCTFVFFRAFDFARDGALPRRASASASASASSASPGRSITDGEGSQRRSEEHTSELQSQSNLVCRLLLEKKKKKKR